ncbi:hypothetical protein [Streptomyces sp. SID3212]|uniref:hypothetical protein n=1 Tax=Streptomyces sp. SID3212 TaxID=2690259 RepID=UPI0013690404|nr:hypothetical protein [Streptomyces sp. SID3212]MYV57874.1 hypothetical protein [Streptomyces sp. SID3212]
MPALVLILIGRSDGGGAACTLAGADSGVGVVWKPADFKSVSPAVVRLCVNKTCTQGTVTADSDAPGSLSVVRVRCRCG